MNYPPQNKISPIYYFTTGLTVLGNVLYMIGVFTQHWVEFDDDSEENGGGELIRRRSGFLRTCNETERGEWTCEGQDDKTPFWLAVTGIPFCLLASYFNYVIIQDEFSSKNWRIFYAWSYLIAILIGESWLVSALAIFLTKNDGSNSEKGWSYYLAIIGLGMLEVGSVILIISTCCCTQQNTVYVQQQIPMVAPPIIIQQVPPYQPNPMQSVVPNNQQSPYYPSPNVHMPYPQQPYSSQNVYFPPQEQPNLSPQQAYTITQQPYPPPSTYPSSQQPYPPPTTYRQ